MKKSLIIALAVALSACSTIQSSNAEPHADDACFAERQAVQQIVELRQGASHFSSLKEIERRRQAAFDACIRMQAE